jgi:hypothetical protein
MVFPLRAQGREIAWAVVYDIVFSHFPRYPAVLEPSSGQEEYSINVVSSILAHNTLALVGHIPAHEAASVSPANDCVITPFSVA